MNDRRESWCAASLALFLAAACAFAQGGQAPTIPPDVLTATTPLNEAQQKSLNNYVEHYVNMLMTGESAQVSAARDKLVDPIRNPSGSDLFRKAYSTVVSSRLLPTVGSDRVIVRLNTMLVVSNLVDAGLVPLIQAGLKDKSPATRYLAAVAARMAGSRDEIIKLSAADQQRVLTGLAAAVGNEKDPRVIKAILEAMAELPHATAAQMLLNVLNKRIDVHMSDPQSSLSAEIDSFRRLFTNIVKKVGRGEDLGSQTLQQLALVAFRYLSLSAQILDKGMAGTQSEADFIRMTELADSVLVWAVGNVAPEAKAAMPQTPIKPLILQKQWVQILLRLEEWRKLLTVPPIALKPAELVVVIPEKQKQP